MFDGYRFEHPKTEVSIEVTGWGYLWAGLFGAGYVWHKGSRAPEILKALAYNVSYLVFYLGVWGITSFVPQVPIKIQALILLGLVPTLILIQANTMVRILREGYRRRGWMIRIGG